MGHTRLPLKKFWDLFWAQESLQLIPTLPTDHGSIKQGAGAQTVRTSFTERGHGDKAAH